MFKSLKEKLKGWISKSKEETEEEVVETPIEEKQVKEATKQTKKPKEKKKEKKEEKKEEKKSEEKKKETPQKEVKEKKETTKKEVSKEEKPTISKEEQIKKEKEETKQTVEEKEEPKEKKEESQKSESIKEKTQEPVQEEIKEEKQEEKKGFFKKFFGSKKETKEELVQEKIEEQTEEEKQKTKEQDTVSPKTSGAVDVVEGKGRFEQFASSSTKEKDNSEEMQIASRSEHKAIEEVSGDDAKPIPEEPIPEPKQKKKHGFSLFKRKTLSEEKFSELFDELELILLQNNVALEAIENIKASLKEKLVGESSTDIETALKESIETLLINPPNIVEQIKAKQDKPFVILFAGINGAGKTTTIAKVTHLLKKNNFSVCLASADTFRAAAIEQLQVHADRLEVPLIKKDYGADPASVGFDAIKYAKKNNIDCVLIDTAGRMNNRDSLMKEIEKITRVNNPDLKIFLGESTTGNDATQQAKDFNDAIGIDGIILSKADVDEKGGTAISVAQVTNKPIYFLGIGQTYDDLEIFDKEKLIEKIFN